MGFLSALFKKNNESEEKIEKSTLPRPERREKKGYPSANGLYPAEAVMLFYAPDYKVSETKYPDFFRVDYGIGFPKETFEKLEKKGYLRPSAPNECLDKCKLVELKEIASKNGLKVSGKKAELVARIKESVSDDELSSCKFDRYWVLTEKGKQELEANQYLEMFVGKHTYSLANAGITMLKLNELCHKNPDVKYRDVVWGELNRLSVQSYTQANKNGEFDQYCTVLETMSHFVEEESKFLDALQLYCRYEYYRINFKAGFQSLGRLRQMGKMNMMDTLADLFFMDAEVLPYEAEHIKELMAENQMSSEQFRKLMADEFDRINDEGYFPNQDLVEFIMCELVGDADRAKALCLNATKRAKKKMKR